jgi:ribosomal protein S18 acetylase RimI-like enzyme
VPQHEIFLTAPGGQVASYCIVWTDALNKEGHFEPVGTHADFQRKGLGRRLLYEAMRQLKAEGMEQASICTGNSNTPAIALYEAAGFRQTKKLLTFTKRKS